MAGEVVIGGVLVAMVDVVVEEVDVVVVAVVDVGVVTLLWSIRSWIMMSSISSSVSSK